MLGKETGSKVKHVDAEALEALVAHKWPGNVRELQNVVHRAVLSCDSKTITTDHLPQDLVKSTNIPATLLPSPRSAAAGPDVPLLSLAELEQRAIRNTLAHTGGSVGKAAKLLGIGRATLYRRLSSDDTLLGTPVASLHN
jgi:DNA-binding NtrC family response regulator